MIDQQIQQACNIIKSSLRSRKSRRARPQTTKATPGQQRVKWLQQWSTSFSSFQNINGNTQQEEVLGKAQINKRAQQEWKERWDKNQAQRRRTITIYEDTNSTWIPEDPSPTKEVLTLHHNLRKAESSILVQARTGKIGLNKFLYQRGVPGIFSAQCQCQRGEETTRHLVLFCSNYNLSRENLIIEGHLNYRQLIGTSKGAQILASWLIKSGRLGQYSLAKQLLFN